MNERAWTACSGSTHMLNILFGIFCWRRRWEIFNGLLWIRWLTLLQIKHKQRCTEKLYSFFEKSLSYSYQYWIKRLNVGNRRLSSYLVGNLTVLLFLDLPLGIWKSAHVHTSTLNIKEPPTVAKTIFQCTNNKIMRNLKKNKHNRYNVPKKHIVNNKDKEF